MPTIICLNCNRIIKNKIHMKNHSKNHTRDNIKENYVIINDLDEKDDEKQKNQKCLI